MFSGKFFRSLTILTSGSFIALLVLGISQIAVTRIFTPEALGIYSFIMAVPMAFTGVLCGRYDLPLVYEKEERRIFPLIKLNLVINLILSSIITVAFAGYILLFKREYTDYVFLVPVTFIYLVSYGLTQMLNSYNNRYKEYKTITKMHIYRTIGQNVSTLILGLIFITALKFDNILLSVTILVGTYCIGMSCGIWTQGKFLFGKRKEIWSCDSKSIKEVASIHKKQPLLSAPAIFANSYSYSLITILIEDFFGTACTGFYSVSTKILGIPLALISSNVSKVYMEEAAKEYNSTGKFNKTFKKTFAFLAVLAVPMFFAMYFLAPPVCGWIFGEEWVVAGEYIRILAFMFAFRLIATALSPGLYVCRAQMAEFIIQFALLAVTIIAGAVSFIFKFDINAFLLTVASLRSMVLIAQILTVYFYSRGRKKSNIGGGQSVENVEEAVKT